MENKELEAVSFIEDSIDEDTEDLIDQIIDLEEYAKVGRKPPKAKGYKFKVNDAAFVSQKPKVTGREVLELANLLPVEDYRLRLKITGGKPEPIGLNEVVDLRRIGVEKFRAIRQHQNEGFQGRREAPTLEQDHAFLESYGLNWETVVDGSIWVLIYDFPLPPGFTQTKVILAVRIEGGYPHTALDMLYIYPAVQRLDGKPIKQSDVTQQIGNLNFQRWSRHRTEVNPWTPGQDSLETHIYFIEEAFNAEVSN